MKCWKPYKTGGRQLPNQDKIRHQKKNTREYEVYKYLGILEAYTIKLMEMKEKI